jgi:hypothetical protein
VAGTLRAILPRVPILCPVISISLYVYLKKPLAVKQFLTDAAMKQAVTSELQTLNTYFFCAGIQQALVPRWDKCLSVSADCVGFWCVRTATHVPCIHLSQNKVLDICDFFILRVNQVLNSYVRMPPFGSAMFCCMLNAQLFLLPQHILHREHSNRLCHSHQRCMTHSCHIICREMTLRLMKVTESYFNV